jgi:hypothetical protein
MLINNETNPVLKNFSLAKKDALRMLNEDYNPWLIILTLSAYFDESVSRGLLDELG